jgi:23S rRNA pseudouridine1911/1915/1917 synthase
MKQLDNDLKVFYLDNHVLAVEKPSGIPTQKALTGISLEEKAKEFLKNKFNKKGEVFLHPVHRLDKPVSGIVLFARTSKALSRLNKQLREHQIKRIYLAKVKGHLQDKKGCLKHHIVKKSFKSVIDSSGKLAVLSYEVVKEEKEFSFLKIELETGRYHQIRAQLSYIGHPIVGDEKYGSEEKNSRLMLHHYQMQFTHPISNELIEITSDSFFI